MVGVIDLKLFGLHVMSDRKQAVVSTRVHSLCLASKDSKMPKHDEL